MKLQSACLFYQNNPARSHFACPQRHTVKHCGNHAGLLKQKPRIQVELKSLSPFLRNGAVFRAANLNSSRSREFPFRVESISGSEPFRGKSGSVSFRGLSHQSIEESKLVSAPFKENTGSLLWVLAPVALIAAFVVPQFFIIGAIEDAFKNVVFAEIFSSFSTEIIFYVGLAIFLLVTEHVQKPYIQFSSKRWSVIAGLRGYLTSEFFTMGFKAFAPLIAVCVTWPVLGLPALISVAPFLVGCLAQYAFERRLDLNGSSCWPLVPIIFDVYRIHQLMRATSFIEKLMYGMREASVTPEVLDKTMASISLMVTFRILGVVCLWSLLSFLLRLFPSRPVVENS